VGVGATRCGVGRTISTPAFYQPLTDRYRGVIHERDIVRCESGQVTYRFRDSDTKKDDAANAPRGCVSLAGVAARVAQGVSPFTQLWVFASQQQTDDFAVEVAGVQASSERSQYFHTATTTAVHLLWRARADRAQKDIAMRGRATDTRV
jgi:hypothetical protein